MEPVITYLPDRDFTDLYKTVKQKKYYSEQFGGDPVETKMWIQDGRLMSQMKGDLRIKQIKSVKEMNPEGLVAISGFAKSVQYLVSKGFPFGVASEILLRLYAEQKIPKSFELPTQVMDSMTS